MKKIELLFICKDEPHYPFEGLDKFLTIKKVKVEPVWKGGDKFISIACDVEDCDKHENGENPIMEIRSSLEVDPFDIIME